MAKQVELRLDTTPFVRRGEKVVLHAKPKRVRWFGEKKFFFCCDGAAVLHSGDEDPRAFIDTSTLDLGCYLVKAHFEQGASSLDQADAVASFLVNEW